MMLQRPVLTSDSVHVNQRLMNMTRAMVQREADRVRDGNGRPGMSVRDDGALIYTDRDERGRERTRQILPLEDRDTEFQALHEEFQYPGLARFHELVQQRYAGIGRRKTQRWYQNSMNNQLHSRMQHRNIVRPVTAAKPGHLQIDLTDHSNAPSGAHRWCFNCIDIMSRHLWVEVTKNKEGPTCARALLAIGECAGGSRNGRPCYSQTTIRRSRVLCSKRQSPNWA